MKTKTFNIRLVVMIAIWAGLLMQGWSQSWMTLYECLRVEGVPIIDGVLDDPTWKSLPKRDDLYVYFKDQPLISPLRTTAQLGWNDQGLYIGLTLYDDVAKLRARILTDNDVNIWMDDCVELYFDPEASGGQAYKLTVNNVAVTSAGPSLECHWNPVCRVACGRGKEYWTIEMAIPWSAFPHPPANGNLWGFDLVRFSFTTGKFRGANWTPGAQQGRPYRYGYLWFRGEAREAMAPLISTMTQTRGGAWQILEPAGMLTYSDYPTLLQQRRNELLQTWYRLNALLDGSLKNRMTIELDDTRRKLGAAIERVKTSGLQANGQIPQIHEVLLEIEKLKQQVDDLFWQLVITVLAADCSSE